MEDLEEAKKLEKSVLKVFDKVHNPVANESSEAEALELLSHQLLNPAEVRDNTEDQLTLLHHACRNGWCEVAKVLIEKYNCDPNCRNAAGSIPLRLACWSGNLDLVKYLLDKGCDPNDVNSTGQVPLHNAAFGGHLNVTKFLIECYKVNSAVKDSNAWTPLHSACKKGHLHVAKYLIEEKQCDPGCRTNDGATPLHLASLNGHLDMARYLIEEKQCDPACRSNGGDTPLHVACLNGHLDMAKYFTEEKQCDPACSNKNGWTPLHNVCQEGYLDMVKYFIEEQQCDPACKNNNGQMPLHSACLIGHLHVAKYLIEEQQCDPACKKNSNGWTPLHFACSEGRLSVAKYLIEVCNCDPKYRTNDGSSPLFFACNSHQLDLVMYLVNECSCNLINSGILISKNFMRTDADIAFFLISSCKVNDPNAGLKDLLLHPAFKVFVMGNFSSGKSTLVKAIGEHFQAQPNFVQKQMRYYQMVTGVELHTAGIISTDIQIPNCGRVMMYDFAGQAEYYSSHAAICENLMTTEGCLVYVVFNLSKTLNECVQELRFWQSFINNQLKLCVHYPPILFVASYADVVKSQGLDPAKEAKKVIYTSFGEKCRHDIIFLDCRLKYSPGLQTISECIAKLCTKFHERNIVETKVHVLLYFIRLHFKEKMACLLEEVFQLVSSNREFSRNGQLPGSIDELSDLLTVLNASGVLLFLKEGKNIEKSWLILKKDKLFGEINGTIFTPENFRNYHKISNSTGVVPLSNIKKLFPHYNPQMLVGFMMHLEYCHEISKSEAKLINTEPSISAADSAQDSETFYFFPALVKVELSTKAFFSHTNDHKYGWCLQRVNPYECLTSRFLHTLLLRLAFTFALQCEQEAHSIVIQRECNIWKNGIHWINIDGVEVIVETVEQSTAVVVVFGCMERNVIQCLKLRSAIISMVLSTVKQFCGTVEVKEYFIDPEQLNTYPLRNISDLFKYSISRLALTIKEQKEIATVKVGEHFKTIEIDKLLFFEPYMCLSDTLIAHLYSGDENLNQPIPDSFLLDFATSAYLKQSKLKQILPLNESELAGAVAQCDEQYKADQRHQCFLLLRTWRDGNENTTFNGLRELLNSVSIFCGRNPLDFVSDAPGSVNL